MFIGPEGIFSTLSYVSCRLASLRPNYMNKVRMLIYDTYYLCNIPYRLEYNPEGLFFNMNFNPDYNIKNA